MQKDDRTHVTDSNQTKVLGLLCSSLAHSICTWGDLERVVVAEDKARLKQFQRDLAPLKISLPDGYSSVEQFGNALTEVQKAALAGFIAQQNVQGMFMAFAANQEDGFSIPAQQVEVKLMLSEEGDVTAQMRVPLQTSMSRTPIDDEAIILGDATIMLTVPKDARAWLDMNCALTIEPTEAGRAIIGAQLDPLARDVELFTSAPIASRNSSPLFVRRASKEAQNPVAQMTELYAAEPAKACVLAPVFINNLSLRDWEHERNAGNSGLGSLQKMLEKECPGHQKHLALETIEAQAARAPKTGVIKRLSGIFYKPPSPPQTPPLMNDLPDKRGEFPPQLPRSKSQSGSDRL